MQSARGSAIIVAAGKGKRMDANVSKQFLELNGKPILVYTLEKFFLCDLVQEVILVVGKADLEYCQSNIIETYFSGRNIKLVEGGKERQDSVYNGLLQIENKDNIVIVHDGVRPFIRPKDITMLIHSAYENKACIIAVRVKDTIKICEDNVIVSTPKRENLWAAQTPQAFEYSILKKAYELAHMDSFVATDDSMLVERMGIGVKIVEGSYDNIKITTKEDLIVAKKILENVEA